MSERLLPSMHHSWAPVHLLASLVRTDYDTHHHEKWGINTALVLKHSPDAMGKHLQAGGGPASVLIVIYQAEYSGPIWVCAFSPCLFKAVSLVPRLKDALCFCNKPSWSWLDLLWLFVLMTRHFALSTVFELQHECVNSWHVCAVNRADGHLMNVLSGIMCVPNNYDTVQLLWHICVMTRAVWIN